MTSDLPMFQIRQRAPGAIPHHLAFIASAVRSSPHTSVSQINEAESAYIAYLEQRILRTSPDAFGSIFPQENPRPTAKLFEIMTEIASCMRNVRQFSIADAVECLKNKRIIQLDDSDHGGRVAALRVVFTMCGWISMLYNPILTLLEEHDGVHIDGQGASSFVVSTQPVDRTCRPLAEVLRGFGDIVPSPMEDSGIDPSSQSLNDALLVAHLNAATLCYTGEIQIVWVESISSHLEFNSLDRKLLLFCLPCFCQINLAPKTASNTILDDYLDHEAEGKSYGTAFMKEVLLSYKLLFGDDERARKLYRKCERQRMLEAIGGQLDPVLDKLCGFQQPEQSFLAELTSNHRISYSKRKDFPIFSSRLIALDDYIFHHRPNRLSTLWTDRRDLLSWYTFWTLLTFGVIGIVCSALQVVLAAMQVALAFKSLQS